MLLVCYSYVLVCHSYVFVCTCMLLVWCFSNDRRFAPPKNNGEEKRKPEVQLSKQHKRDIPNSSWFSLQTFLSHQRCVIFYMRVNRRKEYLCISPQHILFFLSNFISLCLLDEQFSDQWATCVQLSVFPA